MWGFQPCCSRTQRYKATSWSSSTKSIHYFTASVLPLQRFVQYVIGRGGHNMQSTKSFRPPNLKERQQAVSMELLDQGQSKSTTKGSVSIQRLLEIAESSGCFQPMNRPSSGDWLDAHHEAGQSVQEYVQPLQRYNHRLQYRNHTNSFLSLPKQHKCKEVLSSSTWRL